MTTLDRHGIHAIEHHDFVNEGHRKLSLDWPSLSNFGTDILLLRSRFEEELKSFARHVRSHQPGELQGYRM